MFQRNRWIPAAIMLLMVGVQKVNAQESTLPPNPEPGKCYVRCITPDVWEEKEISVMVRPAYKELTVVPAQYKEVEEKIMIKPATKKYIYHPAEFKTVTETIQIEDPYNALTVHPATFRDSNQVIEIAPATARFEFQGNYENCKSDDPRDCMVLCYVEYPAQYRTIPIKLLNNDAYTTAEKKGGKTITIEKQVIVKDAWVEEVEIPAEYTTITKRVLVKDETVEEKTIPAEYVTETIQVLKEKGGLEVWEEIDCELVDYNILPIFWNFGSATLTPEAKKVIDDKILALMLAKPYIRIEIASHTDSRGSDEANMALSQRRAEAVVNYLVSRGISRDRLVAKGYGETRLVNKCDDGVPCTEEEHKQNRRTEFRVLSN